jgi:hypothetical protein
MARVGPFKKWPTRVTDNDGTPRGAADGAYAGVIGNGLAKRMITENIITKFPKHSDRSHQHHHFCCSPKIKWQ